jgi:MFS family permease
VLLLFGISNAAANPTGPATVFPVLGGIVAFILFAIIEARQGDNAAIPIRLFTRGMFVAAVVSGIAWNLAQAVVQLQTSNFWQYVQRQSTLEVSLQQLPFLLVVAVTSLLFGSFLSGQRLTLRTAMIVGFVALTAGFVLLAFVSADSSYWFFLPALVVLGIGLSGVSIPQAVMFVSEAPEKFFGAVTSFRTTVGQLGYAIGLAGGVVLVQTLGQFDLVRRMEAAGVPPSNVGQGLGEIALFINQGTEPVTTAGQQALAGLAPAYAAGFNATMFISAAIMLVLGVVTIVFMNRQRPDAA